MEKPRAFYIDYNAKFVAYYKTLRGALSRIKREAAWKNDADNVLRLFDSKGDEYNPITGCKI